VSTLGTWDGQSVATDDSTPTLTMAQALEGIFINATVSFMSSPLLQYVPGLQASTLDMSFKNADQDAPFRPNYTSPYAPSDVEVTTTTYRNLYVYSASILWISYGLAIGATLLSVLTGFFAAIRNQGTYSNSFSTVFRVTHNVSLSAPLDVRDTDGKSPVRKYVEDIAVGFGG